MWSDKATACHSYQESIQPQTIRPDIPSDKHPENYHSTETHSHRKHDSYRHSTWRKPRGNVSGPENMGGRPKRSHQNGGLWMLNPPCWLETFFRFWKYIATQCYSFLVHIHLQSKVTAKSGMSNKDATSIIYMSVSVQIQEQGFSPCNSGGGWAWLWGGWGLSFDNFHSREEHRSAENPLLTLIYSSRNGGLSCFLSSTGFRYISRINDQWKTGFFPPS